MSVAEELDKLKKLLDDGTITDEQYERARTKLLERQQAEAAAKAEEAEPPPESEATAEPAEPAERDESEPRKKRKTFRRYREREDYEDDYERRPSRHRRQQQAREWSMFLHLSLFAGHAVPLGGIIAPIIIWQTQKEAMPEIDEHGKNAVNWIISNILYALICIPLCFIGVGFLLLIVLGILNIVFPIMAALEANAGRVWHYPLAIRFVG